MLFTLSERDGIAQRRGLEGVPLELLARESVEGALRHGPFHGAAREELPQAQHHQADHRQGRAHRQREADVAEQLLQARPPEFPAPPGASVEWVGKNIELNGITSSIRAFHTDKSIEDVVNFYRKEWRRPAEKDLPGYLENIDAAPWYIISRIEDDYLLTVQVQVKQTDQSASWGYLASSPLPEGGGKAAAYGAAVPKISGSQVISEMKSDDPGKTANTVIISNTNSVRSNADFYRQHYQSKGWVTETDRRLGRDQSHSLVFKNRRNRVTIMVMKDKHFTRVVVNSVKSSVF